LTVRAVQRLADDAPDGVSLQDAARAAMLADPRIDDRLDVFANDLRSLPPAVQLFAAVDRDGVVRATSGSGAFDIDATVFCANTDPEWRRRGIGHAMTAAALRGARERGVRRACLDATDAGRRIYSRLGFEAVTKMTRFLRTS